MWGEAEVIDIHGVRFMVRFITPRGLGPRDKYKVRNIRVHVHADWGDPDNLPVLPARSLPDDWRAKLQAMRDERERLREEWRQARERGRRLRGST